ncbi:serine hydrolase [Microcoleus sp. F10-C6]|uniref:serine hydrolase n=1 Tax=unclassified Microcoleus TaxID=2642155 RepID=UPI002FD48067
MTDSTTAPKSALSAQQLRDFKKKFEERMDFYKIPGAALGIVTKDQVLVSQGFGMRNLETKELVTTKTLFALGSVTKSLTAFMIATQVDEGLYTWDTPVSEISSQYKFPDAITHPLKVKDLLGMTSGIEGAINPYAKIQKSIYGSNGTHWNDQSAIHIIRNIPLLPCWPGSYGDYYYNNELFASAGYLTPLKNKKPTSQLLQAYTQLMNKKVFNAIGMESTRITGVLSSASKDYAVSYGLDMSEGIPKIFEKGSISINYIGGVAPAGQCVSNVEDMNRYLITLLNNGVNPDGQRVVEAGTLQELWNVEGKKSVKSSDEGITGTTKYGMGWWIEEIERKSNPSEKITIQHHGGFLPSWFSIQMLVPEKNIGMIILANGCFGRWFGMEMDQELLKLLYPSDFEEKEEKKFINNENSYNTFLENFKQAVSKDNVSSYTISSENLGAVEKLLGNYEGGWTLDLDQEHHLVLFKDGWVYHLYPSRENPLYTYYIGASNDHRGIRARKNKDNKKLEATKICFFKDENVIQMIGPQIGQIKKLPNPLEVPEVQVAVISMMRDNLVSEFKTFVQSIEAYLKALADQGEQFKDKDKVLERLMSSYNVGELLQNKDKLIELLQDKDKLIEQLMNDDQVHELVYGHKLLEEIKNLLKQIERMKQFTPAMISRYEKVPTSERKQTHDNDIDTLNEVLEYLEKAEPILRDFISTSSKEPISDSEVAFSTFEPSEEPQELPKAEDINIQVSPETTRAIADPENQLD